LGERLDLEGVDDCVVLVCGFDVPAGLHRRYLVLELNDCVEPEVRVLRWGRIADGQDQSGREDDVVEQRVERGQYTLAVSPCPRLKRTCRPLS